MDDLGGKPHYFRKHLFHLILLATFPGHLPLLDQDRVLPRILVERNEEQLENSKMWGIILIPSREGSHIQPGEVGKIIDSKWTSWGDMLVPRRVIAFYCD